jgi:hypothetical protein
MSHKQKMDELRQLLERWRSHNEVHAKPADERLYEFLRELLKLGEEDELQLPEIPPTLPEAPQAESSTDDPPGGNNPESPDIP